MPFQFRRGQSLIFGPHCRMPYTPAVPFLVSLEKTLHLNFDFYIRGPES